MTRKAIWLHCGGPWKKALLLLSSIVGREHRKVCVCVCMSVFVGRTGGVWAGLTGSWSSRRWEVMLCLCPSRYRQEGNGERCPRTWQPRVGFVVCYQGCSTTKDASEGSDKRFVCLCMWGHTFPRTLLTNKCSRGYTCNGYDQQERVSLPLSDVAFPQYSPEPLSIAPLIGIVPGMCCTFNKPE